MAFMACAMSTDIDRIMVQELGQITNTFDLTLHVVQIWQETNFKQNLRK